VVNEEQNEIVIGPFFVIRSFIVKGMKMKLEELQFYQPHGGEFSLCIKPIGKTLRW